ncbi:signal peptidase I [Candidatus Pacearchaeota archaeon]|nr:signal peptidase I [Candidatus Pacearchaeota archaeon]
MEKENSFLSELKRYWQKFWFIVWKDDSFKGWIFSILFIFIVIKLIFFPVLNLATGTSLPLAIVESCSMYHNGNMLGSFDKWWEKHDSIYADKDIAEKNFKEFIFKKGFNKGDILFIVGINPEDIKIGDVIIFKSQGKDIIHRVVDIKTDSAGKRVFSTMGDNVGRIQYFEEEIKENQIVGKAAFKLIPYIGWAKLIIVDFMDLFVPGTGSQYVKAGFCEEN